MGDKNKINLIIFLTVILLLGLSIWIVFKFKKNSNDSSLLITKSDKHREIGESFDFSVIRPQNVFQSIGNNDYLIIDTRVESNFERNHIESSVNIPLENVLSRVNSIAKEKKIIFIEAEESVGGKRTAQEISNLGFSVNYLQGGLYNYIISGYDLVSYGDITSAKDRAKVNPIDLKALGEKLKKGERITYLDVRQKQDFEKDHFESALNIPLELLEEKKKEIPTTKILIIDEDPKRSFQAAVRLYDMNFLSNYYLLNPYSELKNSVINKTLL